MRRRNLRLPAVRTREVRDEWIKIHFRNIPNDDVRRFLSSNGFRFVGASLEDHDRWGI